MHSTARNRIHIYIIPVIFLALFWCFKMPGLADDDMCHINVYTYPESPQSISEGDTLTIIIEAYYSGPDRLIKLDAENLPDFAYGWSQNQACCAGHSVYDTVTFVPGYCNSGNYDIIFVGLAWENDRNDIIADSLIFHLTVENNNLPPILDLDSAWIFYVGQDQCLLINAFDPDTLCSEETNLSWNTSGYPFDNGAVLTGNGFEMTLCWEPEKRDIGSHITYFAVNDGVAEATDSILIIVEDTEPECRQPIIIPEPEFTRGLTNEIEFIPSCDACMHEVCYYDVEVGGLPLGCNFPEHGKTLKDDSTITVIIEGLEDGVTYAYFVKATSYACPDSLVFSELTYSTQDASPPYDIRKVEAIADSGGLVIVSWKGVEDAVSYVKAYEISRECNGITSFTDTVPADENNSNWTHYEYNERLGESENFTEGQLYRYRIKAIDAVGNCNNGTYSNPVAADSTGPCLPDIFLTGNTAYYYPRLFSKGTTCSILTSFDTADYPAEIKFQIARDSAAYFENPCQPEVNLYDGGWESFSSDDLVFGFDLYDFQCGPSCIHGHAFLVRAQVRDELGNIGYRESCGIRHIWSDTIKFYPDCYPPEHISNLAINSYLSDDGNAYITRLDWNPARDTLSGVRQYYIYKKESDGNFEIIDSTGTKNYYSDSVSGIGIPLDCRYCIGSRDRVGNERDTIDNPWISHVTYYFGPEIYAYCNDKKSYDTCFTSDSIVQIYHEPYISHLIDSFEICINDECFIDKEVYDESFMVHIPHQGHFFITIRGFLKDGSKTTWSNLLAVNRIMRPPSITNLEIQPLTMTPDEVGDNNGRIFLRWQHDHPTEIDSFTITRRRLYQDPDTFNLSPSCERYLDSGLMENMEYEYCVMARDRFGQLSLPVCDTAIIWPTWMFTPILINPDSIYYFGSESLPLQWDWMDGEGQLVGNIYGAYRCRIETSISPDFPPDSTEYSCWLDANMRNHKLDIDPLLAYNPKTIYCRIMAIDKWDHPSPWSTEVFDILVVYPDFTPPIAFDSVGLSSWARYGPDPFYINAKLEWSPAYDSLSGFSEYSIEWLDGDQVTYVLKDTFFIDESIYAENPALTGRVYTLKAFDKVGNHRDTSIIMPFLEIPAFNIDTVRTISWSLDDISGIDSVYAECGKARFMLEDSLKAASLPEEATRFDTPPFDSIIAFDEHSYFESNRFYYYHMKSFSGNFQSAWSEIDSTYNNQGQLIPIDSVREINDVTNDIVNYPNPFNPNTTISFSLTKADRVKLRIYNIKGELVRTLLDDYMEAASHEIIWDGNDDDGKPAATGVYIFRIVSGDFQNCRKMLLIR